MGRPKASPQQRRSRMVHVRLREEEWAAFQRFATVIDQKPSRILRRLLREAITAGPDYFDDGLLELRRMRNELAAIGRNLNQLVRTANQGAAVDGDERRRVINAVAVQVEAVKGLYRRAELDGVGRAVGALPEDAVLPASQEDGRA